MIGRHEKKTFQGDQATLNKKILLSNVLMNLMKTYINVFNV